MRSPRCATAAWRCAASDTRRHRTATCGAHKQILASRAICTGHPPGRTNRKAQQSKSHLDHVQQVDRPLALGPLLGRLPSRARPRHQAPVRQRCLPVPRRHHLAQRKAGAAARPRRPRVPRRPQQPLPPPRRLRLHLAARVRRAAGLARPGPQHSVAAVHGGGGVQLALAVAKRQEGVPGVPGPRHQRTPPPAPVKRRAAPLRIGHQGTARGRQLHAQNPQTRR